MATNNFFRWHPERWASSERVGTLNDEQCGIYFRLLNYAMLNDNKIRNKDSVLLDEFDLDEPRLVKYKEILEMFFNLTTINRKDYYYNEVVEEELQYQRKRSETYRNNRKKNPDFHNPLESNELQKTIVQSIDKTIDKTIVKTIVRTIASYSLSLSYLKGGVGENKISLDLNTKNEIKKFLTKDEQSNESLKCLMLELGWQNYPTLVQDRWDDFYSFNKDRKYDSLEKMIDHLVNWSMKITPPEDYEPKRKYKQGGVDVWR